MIQAAPHLHSQLQWDGLAASSGLVDFVASGRPFVSNPWLVERFANDWNFNELADQQVWFSECEAGYTDFPNYHESEEAQSVETARKT